MSYQPKHKTSKCRCMKCRAYRASQSLASRRERRAGRPKLVDATPVRDHVLYLGHLGMSPYVVAKAAGVNSSSVTRLIFPNKGRMRTRVHRDTAAAILAVKFDLDLIPDLATVLAVGTHRRLQALVMRGWSISKLAKMIGLVNSHPQLLVSERVTAKKARAVRDLYNQLWDQDPPADTKYQRSANTRASQWAQKQGWRAALDWDDETIDDPAAKPFDSEQSDVVDEVAVRRVLHNLAHGDSVTEHLTAAERVFAATEMVKAGAGLNRTAKQLGLRWSVIRQIADEVAA